MFEKFRKADEKKDIADVQSVPILLDLTET